MTKNLVWIIYVTYIYYLFSISWDGHNPTNFALEFEVNGFQLTFFVVKCEEICLCCIYSRPRLVAPFRLFIAYLQMCVTVNRLRFNKQTRFLQYPWSPWLFWSLWFSVIISNLLFIIGVGGGGGKEFVNAFHSTSHGNFLKVNYVILFELRSSNHEYMVFFLTGSAYKLIYNIIVISKSAKS